MSSRIEGVFTLHTFIVRALYSRRNGKFQYGRILVRLPYRLLLSLFGLPRAFLGNLGLI